jgi:hypothetical protein
MRKLHAAVLVGLLIAGSSCQFDKTEGTDEQTGLNTKAEGKITFTDAYVESDSVRLTDNQMKIGEVAHIYIKGLEGIDHSTGVLGFGRLAVVNQLGDTLIYFGDTIARERMNYLNWYFTIGSMFVPGEKYLAIADFQDLHSESGKLHAELPLRISGAVENEHIKISDAGMGVPFAWYLINEEASSQSRAVFKAGDRIDLYISKGEFGQDVRFDASDRFTMTVVNDSGKKLAEVASELGPESAAKVFPAYLTLDSEWTKGSSYLTWNIAMESADGKSTCAIQVRVPLQ